ncbi:MAG: FMN-binding negative transcriptional regulator [Chitinophagales bacterium]
MYNIPYFKAENPAEVIDFMKENPFAVLCGINETGIPVATHLPLLLEERDNKLFLQGHSMKKQDHTDAYYRNPNVLAIFSGAHSYVSASWYRKQQVASTWNYQAVHVTGLLRILDEQALHAILTRVTGTFESADSPSLVEHMDPEYVAQMMKAIVAFEIEVTAIEHVFKLSQNRDAHSYHNIMTHLREGDPDAQKIAQIMEEKKKD